jgi:hypothetical protein
MPKEPDQPARLLSFSDLLELPPADRVAHELKILDGLLARAVQDKDWTGSLKIFESAHELLRRAQPGAGKVSSR